MSELIFVKRNNEYRVQSRDVAIEDMDVISSMDIPMKDVHALMARITGKNDGVFYIRVPNEDEARRTADVDRDTLARYMFKDIVSGLLGLSKG